MKPSSPPPPATGCRVLIGRLEAKGLPVDKAHFLGEMYKPDLPHFPLHEEVIAYIPRDLPGRLPRTLLQYIRATRRPR